VQDKEGWNDWLQRNRKLRMDANETLWDVSRRNFHLDRYRFAATHAAGQTVLDAACGTGYGSALLGEQAASVTGVDISAEAVGYAQQRYGAGHVQFVQSPIECTSLADRSFSLIVSFETIEHTLSPKAALREFARLLQPDGKLILSTPNDWGYTHDHFFDFDRALLEAMLPAYFERWTLYYDNQHKSDKRPGGIGPLAELQGREAECFIAVCEGPKPVVDDATRDRDWMLEVYENAMWRHRQFFHAWKGLRRWRWLLPTRRWGWRERQPSA
jgi:2-polyprenyl-3-methyl-5-hydroxy-6-metoxy-1,4-benzoquinol methylase